MKLKKTKRPKASIKPVIPESGRVWAISYQDIRRIPSDALEKGDILIVSNDDAPGRMIMQAVPHKTREWEFVDIGQ